MYTPDHSLFSLDELLFSEEEPDLGLLVATGLVSLATTLLDEEDEEERPDDDEEDEEDESRFFAEDFLVSVFFLGSAFLAFLFERLEEELLLDEEELRCLFLRF